MPLVKLIFILMHILLAGLVFHFLHLLQPACALQPVGSACAVSSTSNLLASFQCAESLVVVSSHNKNKAKENICNSGLKTKIFFPFCFRT